MHQDDADDELPEALAPRDEMKPAAAPVAPPRPDEPAKLGPVEPMYPGPPPDDRSPMQQAVLDSGAKPVDGNRFAFQTNEGTVFLASPADMARDGMFDSLGAAKWARAHKVSDLEIDRMMKEDRD